jgi:hypothetical protein
VTGGSCVAREEVVICELDDILVMASCFAQALDLKS